MTPLPTDDKARKRFEMWKYLTEYFPDSFMAEVEVAIRGNEQHNLGQDLHWAREKSTKHLECAFHHMWDHKAGIAKDLDGQYHLAKAIWRLKAELQLVIEAEKAVNSVDLPKEATHGSSNHQSAQSDSQKGLCPPFDPEQLWRQGWIPNTGPITREECSITSIPVWDPLTEIDGPGKGSC